MTSDSSEESEIKIPVPDLAAVRARLAGAERISERHDESNVLFDDARGSLRSARNVLRLRRARGRAVLTFKGAAAFEGAVKRREELETEVTDPDKFRRVLERLGFVPKLRYDKRREEFRLAGCVVALDETPIGTFVEIEGGEAEILAVTGQLGRAPQHFVLGSYRTLFVESAAGRTASDMVFAAG